MGIAGTLAPLPVTMAMWGFRENQRPASWHRDMPGHACFAGIIAALFAQTEFKASHLLLEEQTNYFKIAGSDSYKPEKLFENWKDRFVIDAITYKALPSCYFNQPCIEAARLAIEENGLQLDEVEKIDLYAPTMLGQNFCYYPPRTSVDTASSVKYLTAMYLLTKAPGPDWYLEFERYLADESYRCIADKIEVHLDEELQHFLEKEQRLYARAVIEVGGVRHEKQVSFVKGSPENPFTMKEIENKFLKLAGPIVGENQATGFLKAIEKYERTLRIRQVISDLQAA
jgi:2-methylcitrate dehydratase PrpD